MNAQIHCTTDSKKNSYYDKPNKNEVEKFFVFTTCRKQRSQCDLKRVGPCQGCHKKH